MKTKLQKELLTVGKLMKRLIYLTYSYQGQIFDLCKFSENNDEDARVALLGFIRGELLCTYNNYINIVALFDSDLNLNLLKFSTGEISIPNDILLKLLVTNARQNFMRNTYSLLESGNKKFYNSGSFNVYKKQFPETLLNGFEILRHIRNSMHSNGVFKSNDSKDFSCNYRGYFVYYRNGDFVKSNYCLIYWIIRDSLELFKLMAEKDLKEHPNFKPINQDYNVMSKNYRNGI